MNPTDPQASAQANANNEANDSEAKLNELLARINGLTATGGNNEPPASTGVPLPRRTPESVASQKPKAKPVAEQTEARENPKPHPKTPKSVVAYGKAGDTPDFLPLEPNSFNEAGLTNSDVEGLILKYLLARGDASGAQISDQLCLPFRLIEPVLRQLKHEQMIGYKGSAAMNDYVCQLATAGREQAKALAAHCTYFGAAPIALRDYIASVEAQSLNKQHPTEEDLQKAFSDLLINEDMFRRLGPAVNSGRGMFLFGFPGNGKTSIAERITSAFGETIWIPKALNVDGEILRLYDPMSHEPAPLPREGGLYNDANIDRRWMRIKRPTIIVGGELTMDNLEVSFNAQTGISESPVQLKSNCGTLVIDDFGRQRMSIDELLNRWIVPLEKRYDFLNMSNGKKIQVPFDQLVVFSTNLEPKDLVDDAFLRRIPYKIEVTDPSEAEFRKLFEIMCPLLGFQHDPKIITYLIEKHYKPTNRPFRCCQPRDLLQQVRNYCVYKRAPLELNETYFDYAADNYFAVM